MYMTWRLYVLDQLLTLNILYYSAMLSKEMVYIWDTQCTEWRYTFTNETWLFQTLPHFYTWILKMQWTAENIISVQNSLYKQVDNLLIVSERYYRTQRAKTIDYHLLNPVCTCSCFVNYWGSPQLHSCTIAPARELEHLLFEAMMGNSLADETKLVFFLFELHVVR